MRSFRIAIATLLWLASVILDAVGIVLWIVGLLGLMLFAPVIAFALSGVRSGR